ncbi:DUF1643 domain-containing protein [Rhizobium rhizogenes]|uniref:DUF1643 domain-containing protein n=1 Tax=Rhizobium rhizogenes TaxID=359 RepID=UPI001573F2B1|nr:DUF1643 domain-containing protein [Rhizobium rhizogenes]NTI22396.1 DUF1643 domain-containing protein [Rhizobium rhizogenes]QTG05981.1 DUF1643 domain-containing protein [Rhizobium rhizogenes]
MTAVISACGSYRYRLERSWDSELPTVAFIMLNPSTADAAQDDPTIRRCVGFAKSWGFGRLIVGNLFALRSTDPTTLYMHSDPIGPDNNAHLRAIAACAEQIVFAWGNHGLLHERGRRVAEMLDHCNVSALHVTSKGQPGHPLYVAAATQAKAFFA